MGEWFLGPFSISSFYSFQLPSAYQIGGFWDRFQHLHCILFNFVQNIILTLINYSSSRSFRILNLTLPHFLTLPMQFQSSCTSVLLQFFQQNKFTWSISNFQHQLQLDTQNMLSYKEKHIGSQFEDYTFERLIKISSTKEKVLLFFWYWKTVSCVHLVLESSPIFIQYKKTVSCVHWVLENNFHSVLKIFHV